MADALNISLSGPEFEPAGDAWRRATEAERRAYWAKLAEIAYFIKRQEIARGIGADGEPLAPVRPSSRRDHADGPPLAPHDEASRTARLLDYTSTADGATLFWRASGRQSWAVILGYHARIGGEVRGAPVRDTLGISDRGRQQIAAQARQSWAARHGPARSTTPKVPKVPKTPRHPKIPALPTNERLAAVARAAREAQARAQVEAEVGAATGDDVLARVRADLAGLTRPSEKNRAVTAILAGRQSAAGHVAQLHGMAAPEEFRRLDVAGLTIYHPPVEPWDPARPDRVNPLVGMVRSLAEVGPPPAGLARHTKAIYLSTQANKYDDYWRKEFNNPDHVSLATGRGGSVVGYNSKPVTGGELYHEMGHNLAQATYGDIDPSGAYRAAIDSGEPPVSAYARNNAAEDFAEAVRLYATDAAALLRVAPRRHAALARLMEDVGNGG